MNAGINTLLAHEMIGVGGQEARFGCEFGDFFRSPPDGTPAELLQRGIYAKIAVALKGAAWRQVSMVMLAQAVEVGKDDEGSHEADARAARARLAASLVRPLSSAGRLLSMDQIKIGLIKVKIGKISSSVARNLKRVSTGGSKGSVMAVDSMAVERPAFSEVSPAVSTATNQPSP